MRALFFVLFFGTVIAAYAFFRDSRYSDTSLMIAVFLSLCAVAMLSVLLLKDSWSSVRNTRPFRWGRVWLAEKDNEMKEREKRLTARED